MNVGRLIKTADGHARRQTDQSSNRRLSGKVKDGFPKSYFHDGSSSSCGDPSTADGNGVDLLRADVDDQNNQPIKSINKEQVKHSHNNAVFTVPDNSENHDQAAEPVLDGFPREYFREASCRPTSFVDIPTSRMENGEVKVELDGSSQEAVELSALEEGGKIAEEDAGDDEVIISAAEQCVDAAAFGQHLVIASHINEDGPKLWYLHNGVLDVEMTQSIDSLYKKSLADQNITFGGRNHAQLFCFEDYLVYLRKRSTSVTPCVIQVLPNKRVSIVGHIHLPDSYLSTFLPEPSSLTGPFSMYVVRDGVLEQRGSDLKLLRTIDVPKMTEDIPNLSSNAGKKKLLSYKVAVTEDRRYFVIVCPTVGGKGRYVDVVDLVKNCYVQRAELDPRFVWRVLEDCVYYLVRLAGSEKNFELVTVRTLMDGTGRYDYCCITESDLQIRSPDGRNGVELAPDHSIHVWRTETATPEQTDPSPSTPEHIVPVSDRTATSADHNAPRAAPNAPTSEQPEHCCALGGHVAEVTCVSWASSGSRLLVSGSRDNTVRLWSLAGPGRQLCLFHVLGTIDNVHFDETSRYVVVHCSYAPQRKRAIVLRLTNVLA